MEQDDLYHDPDLASFYDLENGWGDDLEFCMDLAEGVCSILDLGCGTGLLAATLAQAGKGPVAGVDPAGAMLDIARRRPGGDRVEWIRGDARQIRLGSRFELIVLTGHAFQVFLSEDDRLAVLCTIARHLAAGGRFVFDSRNPWAAAWTKWRPATSRRLLEHPELGTVAAWNDVVHDPASGIVTYDTCYRVVANGRRFSARSTIAFPAREEVCRLIHAAGLEVEAWLGDWTGTPLHRESPEIIPVGRLGHRPQANCGP